MTEITTYILENLFQLLGVIMSIVYVIFSIKENSIQIGKAWTQNPTNYISMNAENILLTVNDYNSGGISQPNGMVKITADGFPSTPLFCISMPVSVTHTNDHPTSPVGSITWTADYIFVKTFSGWKRAALSTF